MPEIVIVGGGFGGVWSAMAASAEIDELDAGDLSVSLISQDKFLTIRPRLYEEPSEAMQVPLRPLLEEIGVSFIEAQVAGINDKQVETTTGQHSFDRLVLASGSRLRKPAMFSGTTGVYSVDTYEEATELDTHLKTLNAEATIVVVGASFTGIEIATEMRNRVGGGARIVLIEQNDRAGETLGDNLQPMIGEALTETGVELVTGRTIRSVMEDKITLNNGDIIRTSTVILATGLEASPLANDVKGGRVGPDGRLVLDQFLRVSGTEDCFAAGDVGAAMASRNQATLMSCQHAMPMGRIAGKNAVRDLLGVPLEAYSQEFYATCLDLGSWGAAFTTGWDRQVEKVRDDGKAMKREINQVWIYPPDPKGGREAIFEAVKG